MKTEELINRMIEQEKQVQPATHINERVLKSLNKKPNKSIHMVQIFTAAACIGLVIYSGIKMGSLYNNDKNYASLNINDSEIENLTYLNTSNHE